MDKLVGIPMVPFVVSAVVIVAINIKSTKIVESIPSIAYTDRNSGSCSKY